MRINKIDVCLPAEPLLQWDAVFALKSNLAGTIIGVANARSGQNTRLFDHVHCLIDQDQRFLLRPSADGQELAPAAGSPIASQTAVGLLEASCETVSCESNGGIVRVHGAASRTGLASSSLSSLVIDHAQSEPDLSAAIAEARRVLRPGGRLALLAYDRPNVAEASNKIDRGLWGVSYNFNPMCDDIDEFMTRLTEADVTGFEEFQSLGMHLAACEATWPELRAYLKHRVTPRWSVETPWSDLDAYLDDMNDAWGDPTRRREVWFNAVVLLATAED